MITHVYKIALNYGDENLYKSMNMAGQEGQTILNYMLNWITRPGIPKSKLFAFWSYKGAYEFRLRNTSSSGFKILLCEASISVDQPRIILERPHMFIQENKTNAELFWSLSTEAERFARCKNINEIMMDTPPDTVFCDWIKPLNEVTKPDFSGKPDMSIIFDNR